MGHDRFDKIPPIHREAVRSALVAAFGSVPIGDVTRLLGGASGASPYRVEIGGRRYLARIEGPASPLRNPHQYESLRLAAEAGLAPRLHYVDETARIVVSDFIDRKPVQDFPGGPQALLQALGYLLRRLQATPTFPHFVDYPVLVSRLLSHVIQTGLFADGVLDAHVERLAYLGEAYAAGAAGLVSSHNDLIPSNVLFDGERLWVIDWESAYRNDPLVDVATLLDTFAPSRDQEGVLLHAWLGHAPDEALRVRLAQVRALTRLYYAGVFLSASAATTDMRGETDLSAPTIAELRLAIRERQVIPGAPATKHILGKMFLAAFFSGATPPGFDAAV